MVYVSFLALYTFLILGPLSAMRRVWTQRSVTQCAILEEFGIFLALADKVGGDW